jgi:hypothetical protein
MLERRRETGQPEPITRFSETIRMRALDPTRQLDAPFVVGAVSPHGIVVPMSFGI